MLVLTNHVGYEAAGPKHAVILGSQGDAATAYTLRRAGTGEEVCTGVPTYAGPVAGWKDWQFWTLDFDEVTGAGTYDLQCATRACGAAGFATSAPFCVGRHVLERYTLSNVLYYFKSQRCSGASDRADRHVPFAGPHKGTLDAHGGWYDATGDYGKHLSHLNFATYFNPQQISLVAWSLAKARALLERRENPHFAQYQARLLDEALYGADYLVRTKAPGGSFYVSIAASGPDKRPADRRVEPAMERFVVGTASAPDSYARADRVDGRAIYEAGYRSGAGLAIAALALAATCPESGGDFPSAAYLAAAQGAFAFLEAHNRELTNDGRENIVDDYCALLAAVALVMATRLSGAAGEGHYRAAAARRAAGLLARFKRDESLGGAYWRADDGSRPFFHPSDAGLPVVSLLAYLEIAEDAAREHILEVVGESLAAEISLAHGVTNPFGYSRQIVQDAAGRRYPTFFFPHDTETAPWWQGENARLASLAAAARLAAPYFVADHAFYRDLQGFAADQLNWIMGLNPFDACMLHGSGRNNPEYLFFDSYAYTNCPGGICNGVTAGLHDPNGIDFACRDTEPGVDHDWRWTEQWLPHAAWYMLAVAAGSY